MSIRILLADDHQTAREGLRELIAAQDGMEVVGEASNGRSAVEMSIEMSPDVVIMDIGMPDLNGIEATRRILSENPRCKVIGLSMHSDRRFLSEMLKAGATAYLLKDSAFEELASAIRAVVAGQIYLSPRIADAVVERYPHGMGGGRQPSALAALTARERQVFELLAMGRSTWQITRLLALKSNTTKSSLSQILIKLNLPSVAELKKYALEINERGELARATDESLRPMRDSELPPPLTILINPGSATAQEIASLLTEISTLYRMLGGSGITFTRAEAREGVLV